MSVMLPHDDMTASATASSALAWSSQDSAAATAEGWDVFDSSERGLEIERIDDPEDAAGGATAPTFASDDEAIGHVYARAQEGSALHQKALLMTLTRMKDFAWPAAPNSEALTEAFNECFRVAFQIANTPADNYENDTAWAHAMHSAAYRAYPKFQQVRAMLRGDSAAAEVAAACSLEKKHGVALQVEAVTKPLTDEWRKDAGDDEALEDDPEAPRP